jgi:hypothetical protein
MLIRLRDIETNHFKTFKSLEEFLEFLKPFLEAHKLEIITKEA